ncbi:MAG TPA: hypothetical protein VKU41_13890 [Polyangiaceae bacterium]|nr:hypothetical protein [Polyangiaceae bacterium]
MLRAEGFVAGLLRPGRGYVAYVALAVAYACEAGACTTHQPPTTTYFDRTIAPILQTSCVRTNTGAGCHVADAKGNAFGNLDLSDYGALAKRRDLLLDYGPYLQPSLLAKNVDPYPVTLELWDGTKVTVTTDIKHSGGPILDPTGGAYQTLRRWIENGASENNTGVAPVDLPQQPCTHVIPTAAGFDPTSDPPTSDYALFEQTVNPILASRCSSGNCHGSAVNALYLTCGQGPDEIRWNYFAAVDYLSTTPEASEIVRRPLATSQGGSYHEGGPLFQSVMDTDYGKLLAWAKAHGPVMPQNLDPAFVFFAQKVQPVLMKKGCMMAQCHSAAMFHDYRLRGGSAGSFSLTTTRRNYDFSVGQMSFESHDVNASRLVRKNLYRPQTYSGPGAPHPGLIHRGGSLLEDFGGQLPTGALCDMGNYDYTSGDVDKIPAYCVIYEWHKLERAARNLAPLSAIVYVSRPPPAVPDRAQDFDVFADGASLHIAQAMLTATGDVQVGADAPVDLRTCGLGSAPDVRRPAVSWDGTQIAFAARSSASDPLAIYVMNADGTGCTKQADIASHDASAGGILEHDFDPAFSPPPSAGESERIVFASTRGNLDSSPFDYQGPQRTPEDPSKPNANLYVLEPDPNNAGKNRVRQLTWQLNMERMPSFMQDGRLIFTVEKREPNFYQLALRRQNLDGGDYHPLYAQRASIGYEQATSVVELADKDFATIFSNQNAQHGAGALGVFNRSIGIDFTSTNQKDYLVDPSVIDPNSPAAPEDAFFLHSLRVLANDGSYTTPSALPDGKILVSFGSGDPASFGGDYDVYVLDPTTGDKTMVLGSAGTQEVEAVAVYARTPKGVFTSTPDEPNGHTYVRPNETAAEVTVLDMRVLASLLFQNTPTGRLVENDLPSFDVFEEQPPPNSMTALADCGGDVFCDDFGKVYVNRRPLGTVPLQADGSAHFLVPGGLPIVLHLADDAESKQKNLPRWQREQMTFVPGEHAHQALPSKFFNNLCGTCHGSISGHAEDAALLPDFLTQASQVAAASLPALDLSGPPSKRGPSMGPPSGP